MAELGRNQPCPCGSGRKAKRCCGVSRGPSEEQLARSFLSSQAQRWAPLLAPCTQHELDGLFEEAARLAETDLSLHLRLPRLFPPALERLRQAIGDQDPDGAVAALPEALLAVDTPIERQRLAETVLELHDHGHRIDCAVVAYALLDLAELDQHSIVVFSALYQAMALTTGGSRTPTGLLVAAR